MNKAGDVFGEPLTRLGLVALMSGLAKEYEQAQEEVRRALRDGTSVARVTSDAAPPVV